MQEASALEVRCVFADEVHVLHGQVAGGGVDAPGALLGIGVGIHVHGDAAFNVAEATALPASVSCAYMG